MPTVIGSTKADFDRAEMEKRGMLKPDQPNINDLKRAFDEALAHHLSLPREERIANSKNAAAVVASHVGSQKNGQPNKLLGKNMKLMKAEKGYEGGEVVTMPDGRPIETTGLALSPAYEEGRFNTCPNSKSCSKECLGKTSGGNFMFGGGTDLDMIKGPRLTHYKRTQAMLRNPKEFAVRLHDEIEASKYGTAMRGNHQGVRLNVLSDIHPKVYESLINAHPEVDFYDYTKNNTKPVAPNHHLTYSSTGLSQPAGKNNVKESIENENQNWHTMRNKMEQGHNVAMAFSHQKELPTHLHDEETGNHYQVIDGDTHDFRPLDKVEGGKGVIIGLRKKSAKHTQEAAAKNSGGFFVHYDPQYQTEKGKRVKDDEGNPIPTNKIVNVAVQKRGKINIDNDGKKLGD